MEAVPSFGVESVSHPSGICKCLYVKNTPTDQAERADNLESENADLNPDLTVK